MTERFREEFDGNAAAELRVGGLVYISHTARPNVTGDLVMSEFCSDHGVREIWRRILSNYPNITQPFDTYDGNEMKMILSGWLTALP